MNRKNILILEGGYNEEHEVSLSTSKEVKKVLKNNNIYFKSLIVNPKTFITKIQKYKNYLCFNALHGPFGEDGTIQKILKKNNIKYTHSNIKSSDLCFNKIKAKRIINKNKILTPKYIAVKKEDLTADILIKIKKKFKKFVIKPNKSGSSFGIKIIKNNKDLANLIKKIKLFKAELKIHKTILIEEFISGKELTVSTLKFTNKINALAVTEIKPKTYFFDYKAKYSKGYSKHILPAKINKFNYKNCLKIATKAHKLLGCKSVARTDFLLDTKKNKIYFLETNTQPGLTSISLLPEQAKYKKITFNKIILEIINNLN